MRTRFKVKHFNGKIIIVAPGCLDNIFGISDALYRYYWVRVTLIPAITRSTWWRKQCLVRESNPDALPGLGHLLGPEILKIIFLVLPSKASVCVIHEIQDMAD